MWGSLRMLSVRDLLGRRFLVFDDHKGSGVVFRDGLPEANLPSVEPNDGSHNGGHHGCIVAGPTETVVLPNEHLATLPVDYGPLRILGVRDLKEAEIAGLNRFSEMFWWLGQQALGHLDGMKIQGFFRGDDPFCVSSGLSIHLVTRWPHGLFDQFAPPATGLCRLREIWIHEEIEGWEPMVESAPKVT